MHYRKLVKKRGVSTVIATLLLVAITVVLAGVLFVMVTGLVKTPPYTPVNVSFYDTTRAAYGSWGLSSTNTEYTIIENVSIMSTSSSVPIGDVGFSIVNSANGTSIPLPEGNYPTCPYIVIDYWNATGKFMGQYDIYGNWCSIPANTNGQWQSLSCPPSIYGTSSQQVCFQAPSNYLTTMFVGGGWVTIIYNSAVPLSHTTFSGYTLEVHSIAGTTTINGAIDLQ